MSYEKEAVQPRDPFAARACASLLAGALGDAWGGPYEGRPGPIDARFPKHPRLSDDTLLTLATCEAIIRSDGRVVPQAIAQSFREWFEHRRLTGLGSSTLKALRDLAAGAHWALAGARGEYAAGSGAAMRVAPLAFVLDPELDDSRTLIRDVARITHHSDEAYAGALGVVMAVRLCAMRTRVPEDLLSLVAEKLPDTRVRDRLIELRARGGDPKAAAVEFGNSGYVVDAVPLALLVAAAGHGEPLESVLQAAVSLGGDTDTIASIAGQVVGAAGCNLPAALLAAVPEMAEMRPLLERFVALLPMHDPSLGAG